MRDCIKPKFNKMENTSEIKEFIKENSSLFWYIPEEKKQEISQKVLVEFIFKLWR